MTPREAAAHIKEVDGLLNRRQAVPDEKKKLSITALYRSEQWPAGSKLTDSACDLLQLEERSDDNRWNHYFQSSRNHLGLYRSKVGFYWVLCLQGSELTLEHVGAANDVLAKYKNK